jgi:uncharacterized protein YndB with AHSA1/START domain
MNEFEIVTVIDRPVEDVFAALEDLDKFPRWNPGLAEVRQTSDGPLGVGSTMVYVGRFLGQRYESPSQYTEYLANRKLVSMTTAGPFHLEVESTVEPVDGGTRLTSVYRGESRGFFKLAEPVVVRLTKRHFESAAENLKALLEADAL